MVSSSLGPSSWPYSLECVERKDSSMFECCILHNPGPVTLVTLDGPGPIPISHPYMLRRCIKMRCNE